jgi:O-antigen biosynthesis protein
MISIIVPACGQVVLTRRCVDSIKRYTDMPWELILVSNGSTPVEVEELRALHDGFGAFVHHDEMIGYPRAINEGARLAGGDYLCLLNNDAAFTGPWAPRLVAGVEAGERAGQPRPYDQRPVVISPVIDNVGQACQRLGDQWAPGRLAEVGMIFFVCAVMRRQTFEDIGGLDERFGLGNGEDVQFCEAVKARDGRLLVEPAVFVTHRGSATFLATLGVEGYRRLIEDNRKLREGGDGE